MSNVKKVEDLSKFVAASAETISKARVEYDRLVALSKQSPEEAASPANMARMYELKKTIDAMDTIKQLKNIVRANIHLTEWSPGQIIQYEKEDQWNNYTHWKIGEGLLFDDTCLHVGMNGSLKSKYTMQISGFYNGKII